ncbi:MAG: hypothetical protein JNM62_13045 [Flavobacteriales bacterium]|nr:hypothetical protein [Flavobacteriales bacterium]
MVFHILHENGPENITDAQVLDAMAALNEAFNMEPGDTLAVYPGNTVVTAFIGVEFCLALFDPEGNPTTGIERLVTALTNDGLNPAAKLDPWPRDRYLNVWGVHDAGSTWGYALMPEEADAVPEEDGVVILHNYLGGIGTSAPYLRYMLAHEVGHYLDLYHPWDLPTGFGDCGDDLVDDTPVTSPDIYCPTDVATCAPPTNQYLPNFMNLYACQQMFTEGQKVRLLGALNSTLAQRSSLWTLENQKATGACAITSIGERPTQNALRVSPNPFEERMLIEGCAGGMIGVELHTLDGRAIHRTTMRSVAGSVRVELGAGVPSGAYIVQVSDAHGIRAARVVRH